MTGARVFVEADGRNIAQGKWYALDDRAVFERYDGSGFSDPAVISPATLMSSPSFRQVEGPGRDEQ